MNVKKTPFPVIPAEAGIQEYQGVLDPGFRRGDDFGDFLRTHQTLTFFWPLDLLICHYVIAAKDLPWEIDGFAEHDQTGC